MKTTLSIVLRVERRWRRTSKRWAYVPEHDNLTGAQTDAIIAAGQPYQREGMEQRVVRTTEEVIVTYTDRLASPKQRAAIARMRAL